MNKLKSSVLAGLSTLLFLFPNCKESTLDEIAKPYLGAYECKQATLGSKDILAEFTSVSLEFIDENQFVLYYQEKEGNKKSVKGNYVYDKEKSVITLTDEQGIFKREFPLVDGKLTISLPIAGKILKLEFEQK